MLESRAERSALGAAPDVAVVDVGLKFLSPKTLLLNHTSKKTNDPSTISAQEACFDFARLIFIFATRPKSEGRNRIRIIISLRGPQQCSYMKLPDGTSIAEQRYPASPGLEARISAAQVLTACGCNRTCFSRRLPLLLRYDEIHPLFTCIW